MTTKLKNIEAVTPGFPRAAVNVDGVRVGTVEKYQRQWGIKSYRFRLDLSGPLQGEYVVVGQKRADVIERGIAFAEAMTEAQEKKQKLSISASQMIDDLISIREKLDKSFHERGGGFGEFTSVEADLSGQRRYILDKLYEMNFDRHVVHYLGFGPQKDWEAA